MRFAYRRTSPHPSSACSPSRSASFDALDVVARDFDHVFTLLRSAPAFAFSHLRERPVVLRLDDVLLLVERDRGDVHVIEVFRERTGR
jgi:hypothetical protein